MPKNTSISVNGQSQVPPGFRFHPTEEELLQYYLRKRVSGRKIDLDVIRDVDLNKLEPWDIQEMCQIGTTPQNDLYFFSHTDKKYPTGTRTNRATAAGFWKATGRDKAIHSNCRRIGMRKTLVFYRGRAPHGQKSHWILHEYRLVDHSRTDHANIGSNVIGKVTREGWVVCRIFKQKNHIKTLDSPVNESRRRCFSDPCDIEGSLEQMVKQKGRNCSKQNGSNIQYGRSYIRPIYTGINKGYCHDMFLKLPSLESPNSTSSQTCYQSIVQDLTQEKEVQIGTNHHVISGNRCPAADHITLANQLDVSSFPVGLTTNTAALDRLVPSQINGCQTEQPSRQLLPCFGEDTVAEDYDHLPLTILRSSSSTPSTPASSSQRCNYINPTMDYDSDIDLWSFAPSPSSLSQLKMDVRNNVII